MKPYGEKLCLERDSWMDLGTASLVRSVLSNRPAVSPSQSSDGPALLERLSGWLYKDKSLKTFPLGLDDLKVFVSIIDCHVKISAETPGINERHGTTSSHNIAQARTLLPGMIEFMEAHDVNVDSIL